MTDTTNKDELREQLEKELPPIISRDDIPKYTGGLYSTATMANIDCQGKGPKRKIRIEGRKIAYMRSDLIEWILSRATFL